MIDTRSLKENCDLRRLVEQDLGPAYLHSGRVCLWKCPFHHEKKGFSLAVWSDGYRCFGACNISGDAIDWLMHYRHLSFVEAADALGQPIPNPVAVKYRPFKSSAEPPDLKWQHAAERVVESAEKTLWSEIGQPALNYLMGRGLTTHTIRAARLGYIPGDFRQWHTVEGLGVPCGITIPWFAAGALWAVKVRRSAGMPKYVQIADGSAAGLYGADQLANAQVAMFCEGEFDTLVVQQEAGQLVAAVTPGSAGNTLSSRWLSDLIGCRTVLVAYDTDPAGIKGMERLLKLSPRFHPIQVPHGKDITEFYLQNGDVWRWIEQALTGERKLRA